MRPRTSPVGLRGWLLLAGLSAACSLDVTAPPASSLDGAVGLGVDVIDGRGTLTLLPDQRFYIEQLRFQVRPGPTDRLPRRRRDRLARWAVRARAARLERARARAHRLQRGRRSPVAGGAAVPRRHLDAGARELPPRAGRRAGHARGARDRRPRGRLRHRAQDRHRVARRRARAGRPGRQRPCVPRPRARERRRLHRRRRSGVRRARRDARPARRHRDGDRPLGARSEPARPRGAERHAHRARPRRRHADADRPRRDGCCGTACR